MISEIQKTIQGTLRIENVTWNDPVLALGGVGWSLTASCPWRLREGKRVVFGSFDKDAMEKLRDLESRLVVAVAGQSEVAIDPAFLFDDGRALELFSADVFEPWVLRLPTKTFVSSPG